MKKAFKALLMAWMVCSVLPIYAQQRKYTIDEATNGLRQQLAPERLKQFEWIPGENAYSYVMQATDNFAWIKSTLSTVKQHTLIATDTLITLESLNQQLFPANPLRVFPVLNWLSATSAWFKIRNNLYIGQLQNHAIAFTKWCTLPENAENITVNTLSRHIAYTIKNNLFIRTAEGLVEAVSQDADSDIVNGKSVHRDEFGITKGIFFSPQGDLLAFYRMDQRMVDDYPVIDWSVTPARVNAIKYPMAGRKSHEVTLGIYYPVTRKTIFLNTGVPADHYLTGVTWAPDQQSVFIALLNREQNHLWLNQYSAVTGELIKTLFEETDAKYVHPMHPLTFIPGKPDEFIWWSNRDGYTHLYLYNTQGQLQRQLTKGSWVVNELAGFRKQPEEIVITAAKESPLDKNIYAVNLHTSVLRRLDQAAGWHDALLSKNGDYLLDAYSSKTVPHQAKIVATAGKWEQNLLIAADPLKDFQRPQIKQLLLKADDGTPLYAKLILPVDFDSTKKYPVIIYLYNGPSVQLVRNTFPYSGNLWFEYMAQHGYAVFVMDGRGSDNRGMAFEQATFRQLGTVEMNDQLQGVDYLRSLPFVNQQKMGVHGWSYGGFMTTSLMLRHPGIFQAAIAGGPVIDWRMYEVMYTERYMDTPQENPDGYSQANLLTQTKNLQGHLMLIHGTEDDVVVWQHSVNFLKVCIDNEVQVDYFVYPGHQHNVLGKDRVHLMQKITDYFDAHLK